MSKNKTGNVELYISKELFNSLVSVLTSFIEAGEANKYGVYAAKLKNKIMKYSRSFIHNETENAAIYFYEDEAAMLIKLFAIYISATEDPSEDYFANLCKRQNRNS